MRDLSRKMLILCLLVTTTSGCSLGYITQGTCVPSDSLSVDFCGSYLQGDVCVPIVHELWPEWDASAKDSEVKRSFVQFLEARITAELEGKSKPSFTRSKECIEAYKNVICLMNFPSCKDDTTFPLCNNVCKGYLERCGEANSNCEDISSDLSPCSSALALSLSLVWLW
jgi:hypothetical protein